MKYGDVHHYDQHDDLPVQHDGGVVMNLTSCQCCQLRWSFAGAKKRRRQEPPQKSDLQLAAAGIAVSGWSLEGQRVQLRLERGGAVRKWRALVELQIDAARGLLASPARAASWEPLRGAEERMLYLMLWPAAATVRKCAWPLEHAAEDHCTSTMMTQPFCALEQMPRVAGSGNNRPHLVVSRSSDAPALRPRHDLLLPV